MGEPGMDYCPDCGTVYDDDMYKRTWKNVTDDGGHYICASCVEKGNAFLCPMCERVVSKDEKKRIPSLQKHVCKKCGLAHLLKKYHGKVCPMMTKDKKNLMICLMEKCVFFDINREIPYVLCEFLNQPAACPHEY